MRAGGSIAGAATIPASLAMAPQTTVRSGSLSGGFAMWRGSRREQSIPARSGRTGGPFAGAATARASLATARPRTGRCGFGFGVLRTQSSACRAAETTAARCTERGRSPFVLETTKPARSATERPWTERSGSGSSGCATWSRSPQGVATVARCATTDGPSAGDGTAAASWALAVSTSMPTCSGKGSGG